MRVVGLFAGVGGLELGLSRAGHEPILLSEIDDSAVAVLAKRFRDVPLARDVRSLRSLPKNADLVAAGFPCQDLSSAGATAGISGPKTSIVNRLFELLGSRRVPWLLLENVPNLVHLQRGAGIRWIVQRLESLGYRWAYRVLDTRAFGLPQRRLRVFVVACLEGDPTGILHSQDVEADWPPDRFVPGADVYGFYWTEGNRGVGWARDAVPTLKGGSSISIPSPPALWWPRRTPSNAFEMPGVEDAESLQGLPRGWTDIGGRNRKGTGDRWRMVGNAVSVPVAEWIGERLQHRATRDTAADLFFDVEEAWPHAAHGGPGRNPVSVAVGAWPMQRKRRKVREFVRQPLPLSARAAAGFLSRLERSRLKIAPQEFRVALSEYVAAKGSSDLD